MTTKSVSCIVSHKCCTTRPEMFSFWDTRHQQVTKPQAPTG